MKKKLILSTLCFILLLIMMLSTTLAWFTDSAAANVNTMVAGKVSITQTVVDTQVTVVPTVKIDRTVTVTNDGNLPCYARTLIAFEDKAVEDYGKTLAECLILEGPSVVFPKDVNGDKIQYTADDNTVYTIGYYLHGELAAGAKYECLNSITLEAATPSQWQEAAGEHYQILVLSQAVQTAGFVAEEGKDVATVALTAAFGELTAANVDTWFDTVLTAAP